MGIMEYFLVLKNTNLMAFTILIINVYLIGAKVDKGRGELEEVNGEMVPRTKDVQQSVRERTRVPSYPQSQKAIAKISASLLRPKMISISTVARGFKKEL